MASAIHQEDIVNIQELELLLRTPVNRQMLLMEEEKMAKLLGTEQFSPSDKTFVELQTGKYPWWDNLKKNKNISIQVRKKNTIDVYYNGGAILKDLKFDGQKKGFIANIHPKYIPLEDDTHYQSLALDSSGVKFTGKIDPQALSQFEGAKLKAVIKRVEKYFDAESEKSIQYKFAINDPCIIDTEFKFGKDLRIDLVRLDAGIKRIVFIEIKTMGDPRLFAPI